MTKQPWEWDEADLQAFVDNKAEESVELDFKRSDAIDFSVATEKAERTRKLSKHVSAFANAAGGTIVYGIEEVDHVAKRLDAGINPNIVSRERLEQVINANVRPRVPGLRVTTVPFRRLSSGNVGYVVWVPQGATAHQASDGIFYRRHGTECLPMDAYEIQDVMNRSKGPDLYLEFEVNGRNHGHVEFVHGDDTICSPEMQIWLVNDGEAGVAEHCQCQLFVQKGLDAEATANLLTGGSTIFQPLRFHSSDSKLREEGVPYTSFEFCEVRLGQDDGPTYPGERRQLAEFRFCHTALDSWTRDIYVIWRVRAPLSRPRVGCVVFTMQNMEWYFRNESVGALEDAAVSVELAP